MHSYLGWAIKLGSQAKNVLILPLWRDINSEIQIICQIDSLYLQAMFTQKTLV